MTKDKSRLSPELTISILGLVVLYPVLGWVCLKAFGRVGNDVAFWCASGSWIIALVDSSRKDWPIMICAGMVAATILMAFIGVSPAIAAVFIVSDAIAVLLAATLLSTLRTRFPRSRQLLVLIILASLLHALILSPSGALLLAETQKHSSYSAAWSQWIGTNIAGAIFVLPFAVLKLDATNSMAQSLAMKDRLSGLTLLVGLLLSSYLIWAMGGIQHLQPAMGWLTYIPLVCAVSLGFVWPVTGGVIAVTALGFVEFLFLFFGFYQFGQSPLSADQSSQLRWYLAAAALLSALTSTLSREIRELLYQVTDLRNRHTSSLDSAKVLQFEVNVQTRDLVWVGNTHKIIGLPAFTIATLDTWLGHVDPRDRDRVEKLFSAAQGGDHASPEIRYRLELNSGKSIPVLQKISGLTIYEDKLLRIAGTVQPATARRRGRLNLFRENTPLSSGQPRIRPAVLMIHGIGGSEHDFGPLYKVLGLHGYDPCPLTLPGHRGRPEDLLNVRLEDWVEAVRRHYHMLRTRYEVVHIMGISLGALIALEIAKSERHTAGELVLISAPIHIDGWGVPWYYALRFPLYHIPAACRLIMVDEEHPFGVKDPKIRSVIAERFARGESYHYSYVPLGCVREIDRLRTRVKRGPIDIQCRTLVIHSRADDLTSVRSAEWLRRHLNEEKTEVVLLDDSFHMVCIDNDRAIVAESVLAFLGKFSVAPGSRKLNG